MTHAPVPGTPALHMVVLAAGAARRLGEPKALARLGSRTALEHLLANWRAAGQPPESATVVLGADAERIAAKLPPSVAWLDNPAWAAGRTGTLQRAIRERPGADLMVAAVDTPLVSAGTLGSLIRAWRQAGSPPAGWLAPATKSAALPAPRPGHPIVIGRELLTAALDLDPDAPLRDLRGQAGPLFLELVPDPAIHDDLDTPRDLARLRARLEPGAGPSPGREMPGAS